RRDPPRGRWHERRPLTTPAHSFRSTTMNQNTADSETILRGVLDGWKVAVDKHQPDQVAARFTEDAIFQGMHPYSVGRPGIAAYYDSQPSGLTAEYRVLETRRLSDDLVLGYL